MRTALRAIAFGCAAATIGGASGAVTIVPGASTYVASDNNFNAKLQSLFGGAGNLGFGFVDSVTVKDGETLTFSYIAGESGFGNTFTVADPGNGTGGFLTEPKGGVQQVTDFETEFFATQITATYASGGALSVGDWQFTVTSGGPGATGDIGTDPFGIFYALDGSKDFVVLAFDDQSRNDDDNHDDFLVRLNSTHGVSVVPLPAAGWMLLAGIGGLVAMKRRNRV